MKPPILYGTTLTSLCDEGPALMLVQYDNLQPMALAFRAYCLDALSRLDFVETAYYYDDAIWIHGYPAFTKTQVDQLNTIVAQSAQRAAA